MATPRYPWDQLPGENSEAYHAFQTYLAAGPARNVVDTYRQNKGKPLAKQADGTYNRWAKRFRWADRARAYDVHIFDARRQGEVKAAFATGLDLGKERAKAARVILDFGHLMLSRGVTVGNFPLADQKVRKTVKALSGEEIPIDVTYEGMDARNLAVAARVGQIGAEMILSALSLDTVDAAGQAAEADTLTEAQHRAAADRATALWNEWEADQRRKRDAAADRRQLMPPAPDDLTGTAS